MNPVEERIRMTIDRIIKENGGDVVSCAETIADNCRIKGLTARDVAEGKTPEGIARLWMKHRMMVDRKKVDNKVEERLPMLPFTRLVYDAIKYNPLKKETWDFPLTLCVDEYDVDVDKLRNAIEKTIENHPALHMRALEDGWLHYDKNYLTPYFEYQLQKNESKVFLHFKVNRILGDGASFVLFLQNVWKAYNGQELEGDILLEYLHDYDALKETREYREHGEWLKERYGKVDFPVLPATDIHFERNIESEGGIYRIECPDCSGLVERLGKEHHVSANVLVCLATALAVMDYNKTDKAGLTWAYIGRETLKEQYIFGSLHRDIPMVVTRSKGMTQKDLFASVRKEIEQGIIHSQFPFTLTQPEECEWHYAVNVLKQTNVEEAFKGCTIPFELLEDTAKKKAYCLFDVEIEEPFNSIVIKYSKAYYREESIIRFSELLSKNVEWLLKMN